MKKRIILITLVVIFIISIIFVSVSMTPNKETDNVRFSKEYTYLTIDNIFEYKSEEDIIRILENGTGVVFLGFPECKWCQRYVTYLDEVAKESGIEQINYLNISEMRKNNTENYQKIISLIANELDSDKAYDKDGNLRIFVPTVIVVDKGVVVGFDDETAHDTKGYQTPEEYWENEDLDGLKERLKQMFKLISNSYCTDECN